MKKLNKRIATALIAAAMFAFTSVAASAADYGSTPNYPTPSVPDSSTSVDSSADADSNAADSTEEKTETVVVTDSEVANAIADAEDGTATIEAAADEVIVTEAAIGEIATSGVVVTIVTDEYEIEIDPALIDEVKEIDLTMNITVADKATKVDNVAVPANAIVIAPAQKGEFGMTVKVTVPADTVKGLDTDNLKLYYISDDGKVELVESNITVNADGSVSVFISHASQYVITDEELEVTAEEDDAVIEEDEDDTIVDDDDISVDDDKSASDSNPGTGVALGTAAVMVCTAAAVISKKRK